MIYKYNVACSNKIIGKYFNKVEQKLRAIRSEGNQNITSSVRDTIFIADETNGLNFNTFILCGKLKALYAICAIRTDENYIHQWLILKNPIDGYKKIYLSEVETADTNLYRRMTVDEIKKYFNDKKYDE